MSIVRKHLTDVRPPSRKRLETLKSIEDDYIDLSDIPELGAEFWNEAELRKPIENKEAVTLRVEGEVLDWFKAQGKGYTTRMANILRRYYEHCKKSESTVNAEREK